MQRSKVKDGINSELSRAICRSDVSKVKQLLRTGKVSINGGMSSADPPILECAMSAMYMPAYQNCTKEDESKVLEMLNLLVEHGADVNIQSSRGMNAAMFTARRGLLRCLEFLVETGTDLTMRTHCGETALMCASDRGQLDCVKYLSANNVPPSTLDQVDDTGQTALMKAARRSGDAQYDLCVEHLIKAGADVNIKDELGYTALMQASSSGQVDSVKHLSEHMSVSGVNQVSNEGETALILAAARYGDEAALCLQHLIAGGADVNLAHSKEKYTALMFAVREKNYKALELLLENGALVNIITPNLETPLFLSLGEDSIVLELLHHELDPIMSCRDKNILHSMVAEGKDSAVCGLVMSGFPPLEVQWGGLPQEHNLELQYDGSQTVCHPSVTLLSPLALALSFRRYEIAKYLITNSFLTRYDLVHLCWNQELRQSLLDVTAGPTGLDTDSSLTAETRAKQAKRCLEILDFLSARPLSLRDLCLVTISSALSQ